MVSVITSPYDDVTTLIDMSAIHPAHLKNINITRHHLPATVPPDIYEKITNKLKGGQKIRPFISSVIHGGVPPLTLNTLEVKNPLQSQRVARTGMRCGGATVYAAGERGSVPGRVAAAKGGRYQRVKHAVRHTRKRVRSSVDDERRQSEGLFDRGNSFDARMY